jgi:uroporphyrinogen decarboxylase
LRSIDLFCYCWEGERGAGPREVSGLGGATSKEKGFGGLRVVAFESRFAQEMQALISRYGGTALVAPSMAEVPLGQNVGAFDFAEKLFRGELRVVVFMTGVGTRTLAEVLETRYPREKTVEALSRVTVVARGPKPMAALRSLGVPVTITVPEPNTWREILETMDSSEKCPPLQGASVAVQEYGTPNREFIEGLKKRGANVLQVPVYRWTLPGDISPLREAIRAITSGEIDVALFTNAMQLSHLFQVAGQMGLAGVLRQAFSKIVIASVGPTCSEALREQALQVDLEPEHPKMGHLVKEAAEHSNELLRKKRNGEARQVSSLAASSAAGEAVRPEPEARAYDKLEGSAFMRACRRQPTPYTPVWFMRQAGRYMAEYRELRAKYSFLELCKNSDLAAEVTVTAAHRLGVDAAITFADILLIVEPMGLGLRFEKGDGPVIDGIVRDRSDVRRLKEVEPEESLQFVFEAVRKARAGLRSDIPLIGFAAAPFTLASYITEGGASKNYRHTKALMYRDPGAWHAMMELIARGLTKYLNGQIAAGAQAVQLFDSWVGCLSPEDYREYALPHTRRVIQGIRTGVPVINFSTGTGGYLELLRQAGGDVIGVDWRVDLALAWSRVGYDVGIQGNLDPSVLFSEPGFVRKKAQEIVERAEGRPGHIFNLGHGILPETPVDRVIALVEAVHEMSTRRGKE